MSDSGFRFVNDINIYFQTYKITILNMYNDKLMFPLCFQSMHN